MPVTSPKHADCPLVTFAPGASIPWADFKRIVYCAVHRFSNGSAEAELLEESLSRTAERVSKAFARPNFQLERSLVNFIYTVAKHLTIRHWNSVKKQREKDEPDPKEDPTMLALLGDAPLTAEQRLLETDTARERREKLRRVMESLRPAEIHALRIRYLEPPNRPLTDQERQAVRRAKIRAKELAS